MKRFACILAVLALCVAILPAAVRADGATEVTTAEELMDVLAAAGTDETAPTRIVLAGDIETGSELQIPEGTFVELDLNGHVLRRGGTAGRVLSVKGALTIIDSSPNEAHDPEITYTDPNNTEEIVPVTGGVITGGSGTDGAGILVEASGSLALEGGTVCGNTTSGYGGGVFVRGSLVMNGGAVAGNSSQYNGGGILIRDGGTFEMNSGMVCCNSTQYGEADGGGVYLRNNAVFTLNGGTIFGNRSAMGAGVGGYESSKMIMNGGAVENNVTTWRRASAGGGGIQMTECLSLELLGGTIRGNVSAGYGGGVRVNGGSNSVVMSGSAVVENNTALRGGGVELYKSDTLLTMTDNAVIRGNEASEQSGGVNGGIVVMEDNSAVADNVSSGPAGGIMSNNITLSGSARVSGNESRGGRGGGGIYTGGTVNISENASVSGNTCNGVYTGSWGGGGGIFCDSGTVTMTGGVIRENESSNQGGGVALYYYGTLIMSGGCITENHAATFGGGLYNEDYDDGHFQVFGAPVIIGNTVGEEMAESNVRQRGHSAKYVNMTGALTEGARIGVTMNSNPSASSPVKITTNYSAYNEEDPALFFFSDEGYDVFLDGGEAKAATGWQHLSILLGQGGTVTLHSDLPASPVDTGITLASNVTATLDLNGHVLDGLGTADNVFYLRGENINLTIIDSRPDAEHDPAVTYQDPVTGESVTVKGGVITGSKGAGILAAYGSTLTLEGGTVTGCNMGLNMRGTTVNLTGGAIVGNVSQMDGGGVWVYENATLNMSGGQISCNTTAGRGGGVYLYNNQSSGSVLNLSGGCIENNVSATGPAGVAIGNRGYFTLSGDPVVMGNRAGEEEYNISSCVINGALTEGARVGVRTGEPSEDYSITFTSGYSACNPDGAPARFFVSDREKCVITLSPGGEAQVSVTPEVYLLGAVTVRDGEEAVREEIPQGSFTVTVPIFKNRAGREGVLLMACYDGEGRFLSVVCEAVPTLANGEETEVVFSGDNEDGQIARIRIFPVNSLQKTIPMGEAVTFE